MSFQAPDTDIDPTAAPDSGGFKAPDTDPDPKSLSGFASNLGQDVVGNVKGIGQLAEGLVEHPIDTISAVPGALVSEGKRIGLGELLTGHPINAAEKFGNAAYDKPLTTAFDVAPVVGAAGKALGIGGAAGEGAEAGELAAEGAAKTAETAGEAAPTAETAKAAEGAAAPAGVSLKDLPVMQPGVKTGPPHALFAYNDTFGKDGTPRSIYNVYGDPGDPLVHSVGGYGTSVPKDILDQAGIPVVGREPRSVGKWEPLDTEKAPETPPIPPPGPEPAAGKPPILDTAAQAAQDALDQAKEVKNYVTRGYQGLVNKPGGLADVADWVQAKSQMLAGQQVGITPKQFRDLGKNPLEADNAARAIGQYAMDHDIVSPTTGLRGMLEKNQALLKSTGKTLGDYRKMADQLNPDGVDPKEMVEAIRQELDKKYARGVTKENPTARGSLGGHYGSYLRALQDIEDADHTHQGIANAVTDLNKTANKALKNQQPQGPFTDVANVASRLNNAKIRELLGKENTAKYDQALREFGVNKKIENGLRFKGSGEIKRFGPGSTISNLTQKGLDEFGYRFGAKAANKLSTAIKNNPAVAKSLPSLFEEFINQLEDEEPHEPGMAKGGIVPDDVRRYIASKC